MNLKSYLFDDDRGVSPVIGVILMVAITVILAAVIATFVMNMGPDQNSPANANWDGSYESDSLPHSFILTHEGGGAADAAEYSLSIEDASYETTSGGTTTTEDLNQDFDLTTFVDDDNEMTASDTATVDETSVDGPTSDSIDTDTFSLDGATIQLIWEDPDSDQTQIIETWEE